MEQKHLKTTMAIRTCQSAEDCGMIFVNLVLIPPLIENVKQNDTLMYLLSFYFHYPDTISSIASVFIIIQPMYFK